MSFLPFEDVPLYLGVHGHSGHFIFAESASLSVSQPLSVSRQIDDNILQIASYGLGTNMVYAPLNFTPNANTMVVLGPTNGPPQPLATSISMISGDSKITFPRNKELFFSDDIEPNGSNYIIRLYSTSGFNLTAEEAQSGVFNPQYRYHSQGPAVGSLDVNFYFNTGNLLSIFNITGQSDPSIFPPIDEERITGYIGNFRFSHAYLKSLNFSLSPNSLSQASASFDIYGTLEEDDTIVDEYFNSDLYAQQSVPHGQESQIIGTSDLGIDHPVSFQYSINVERTPRYGIPNRIDYSNAKLSNDRSNDNASYGNFLVPDRVTKKRTTIQMSVEGEGLNPEILEDGFDGKPVDLEVQLFDLNYNDYGFEGTFNDDNKNGFMHTFKCNGVLVEQALSINSAGYLVGSVSAMQVIQ